MQKLSMDQLGRVDVETFKNSEKMPLVVVLDNVRSMNNIGSIFRTCDAFKVQKLCLCGITAQPPHKDIEKTALGATQSVDWQYFKTTKECVEILSEQGFQIVAVEQVQQSTLLHHLQWKGEQKIALVLGNEVMGVEQEIVDKAHLCIEIPQFGTKHSLNVSVSTGIVLWHFCNQYLNR